MFSELNIKKINDTFKLKFEKIKQVGNDLLIIAYPVMILIITKSNN